MGDYMVFTIFVSLTLILSPTANSETVLGETTSDFDFDGLPGAQHEFKVYLQAGSEECFWQPVVQGAHLYTRFEVLKGGDKSIDFFLRDARGNVVEQKTKSANGYVSKEDLQPGTYGLCIDNVYDRFGYKVVYMYIVTIVMQEWFRYQDELQKVTEIAGNFTTSLQTVASSITEMRQFQASSRFNVIRDWYRVSSNLYYVGMWSMIQCAVIIGAAITQVFFVRRLFKLSSTTPTTSKPRA